MQSDACCLLDSTVPVATAIGCWLGNRGCNNMLYNQSPIGNKADLCMLQWFTVAFQVVRLSVAANVYTCTYTAYIYKKKQHMFAGASRQIWHLLTLFWFFKLKDQENTACHRKSRTERKPKKNHRLSATKMQIHMKATWSSPRKNAECPIQLPQHHTCWQSQLSHQQHKHHNTCQQDWSISSTQQNNIKSGTPLQQIIKRTANPRSVTWSLL